METTTNVTTYRTHRVGSITAGLCMVAFGVLLLMHSLFELVDYSIIFSLWPIILIGLGIELLLSNFWSQKIVYDKAAVVLLIVMMFFSIGMAVADICLEVTELYISNGIMH